MVKNYNKKKYFILIILLLCVFFVYAKEYTCIVSLAPSVTKSLYELGAESCVKGITVFCPKGSIRKEIVGTLLDPNIEKIAYIKPDLVIASKDGNSRAIVDKLCRLGFEVYVMEKSENFKDICSNYYDLAEKINKLKKASNTINKAKVYVDKLHNKLNKNGSLRVFWEIGNNPLYTVGGKSFANDYNIYSNTINIYNGINKNYFQVFREDVMKYNPDIILLVNLGNMSKEELSFWCKYKTLDAVQNNRIFIIDLEDMFVPTPLTFAENLSFLAKIVYGDCS
ncbi:MAG: helical backbone metal receptor [Endomicrobium sp.]|jgi:iron complex transport system substrate-binding protein|nr:helical backbone metal receptor [Endomicrobium sp.]